MTNTFTVLSSGLQTHITNAKNFTESLYTNFGNTERLVLYRKDVTMASKEAAPQPLEEQESPVRQRVGSVPILTAALSQLSSIYETTKESRKYVKDTMETAKEGVKEMVGRLDSLVCSRQHDKLEETCPVIFFTKPTKEVVEEPKKEYDSTLKPHVDQTVATTDTSVGKVSAATQYAIETVTVVKDYSVNTVDTVKDYNATKVSDATNYTYVKLGAVATYDDRKLGEKLDTPTGRTIVSKVDQILDTNMSITMCPRIRRKELSPWRQKSKKNKEESMLDPDPQIKLCRWYYAQGSHLV